MTLNIAINVYIYIYIYLQVWDRLKISFVQNNQSLHESPKKTTQFIVEYCISESHYRKRRFEMV